ncbi:PP2C family protein-serine/threonine phosphatase [Streptomyces sp. NPDC058001]|uniref:PP2C family protein-serine/threonine phosphatase n=1 Tax=Streptomyces sp. NPDC058001 TaxID=3346300 RepID=UPI0036DFB379
MGSSPAPQLDTLGQDVDAPPRQSMLRIGARSVAWLPPLLLLMVIAVIDVNTSREFRVISWIVVVPGIAAALCGVWTTAAFSVLSIATYASVDQAWPDQFQTGLPDFILVAVGGVLAVGACWIRVRGEGRWLHMRDIAETTRRTVLRPLPPRWGGLDHAAVYLAADSVARVGGDFYDIQPSRFGTRVLLGDVQGKGLGAVDAAAMLLSSFRESGYHTEDLKLVAERLEIGMRRHRFYRVQVGRDDGDRFATAVLIGFPPPDGDAGHVQVVNFGHQPPLIVGRGGVRELPPGDGLPLGLGDLTDRPPLVQRVTLADDETLLLVTDGVTEARDTHGMFFPLNATVAEAVRTDPDAALPEHLVRLVRDATLEHCNGHLADDTTVFAVRNVDGAVSASATFL